jgi:hypothetical protein
MRRLSLRAPLAALILAAGCAPPPPVAPIAPPPAEVSTPAAAPAPPPPPEEPLPTQPEAVARALVLAAAWDQAPQFDDAKREAWLKEQALADRDLRRLLLAVTGPCLQDRDRNGPSCQALDGGAEDPRKAVQALVELLGEVADPALPGGASLRLLLRLEARGVWRSGLAIDRLLARRLATGAGACAPPTAAEVEAARRSLADLAVVEPAPASGLAARWPSAGELDDLAYFYASVADGGPEVGKSEENLHTGQLPADHPDLAARQALAAEAHAALLDGDVERHLRAAEAYLKSLGYPEPLRLGEEGDQRWGGAAVSFVMRDAALSAEILGRYPLAESLYRRAHPGGGGCGTSTPSRRDHQIEGVIRTAELSRGCRGAVAERLFTVVLDTHHAYGPERLAGAGFDVPRLYAGALHTLHRDDAPALERALQALPSRPQDALARLAQRGPEAWATRVRALPGYADTAKAASLPRLLGLAERGPGSTRTEALSVLGMLTDDRGYDPCLKTSFGIGWGFGSSRLERRVKGVMGACETRLDVKTREAMARRVAAMAGDADPAVREGVARLLGQMALPSGRPVLARLSRDAFDAGGQVCTSQGGPSVCEANRPVARAAKEGLEALRKADEMRARQRAARSGK